MTAGWDAKLQERKGFLGNVILPDQDLIVLFGPNNVGKSAILYSINSTFGNFADYISPMRFQISNEVVITKEYESQILQNQAERKSYNLHSSEYNAPDPLREIFSLSDGERDFIIKWHNDYFGELKIEKLKADNYFSPPKVTIDGLLPSQQGTGSRAILPVLIKLLNTSLELLCIDEPEMGIEPKTQKRLFELIKKVTRGEDGLPKKKIVIATHSHLFIDKEDYKNNYRVTKESGIVAFHQIIDNVELQSSVYSLLGNDPSDLFFPSNILLVEGKSDEVFLKRIYELLIFAGRTKKKNIAFHFCGGYDKAEYAVEAVVQMLKTQGYMPIYINRICGLFDKPTQNSKLVAEIRKFVSDTSSDRFTLLDKDAIEYYYPLEAVRKTLGDATITQQQLDAEVTQFLQQYKSQGHGNFFTFRNIKKVDLSTRIALNLDTLVGLDQRLIDSILKCVSLAFG